MAIANLQEKIDNAKASKKTKKEEQKEKKEKAQFSSPSFKQAMAAADENNM